MTEVYDKCDNIYMHGKKSFGDLGYPTYPLRSSSSDVQSEGCVRKHEVSSIGDLVAYSDTIELLNHYIKTKDRHLVDIVNKNILNAFRSLKGVGYGRVGGECIPDLGRSALQHKPRDNEKIYAETTRNAFSVVFHRMESPYTSHEERRRMIIAAEFLELRPEEAQELLPMLASFIEENRHSSVDEDITAVTSAITTYIGYNPVERAGDVAHFLDPEPGYSMPVAVELEIAKMIYRLFEANPPRYPEPEPELARRMTELAELYFHPRLLPREKYGATALNACQALAAMRSEHAPRVLAKTPTETGFRTQLARRLKRLLERWKGHKDAQDHLQQFIDKLNAPAA